MANPAQWLADQAKTGLTEMPRNVRWLKSRFESQREAAGSKATEVAATARSRSERARQSVTQATPGGLVPLRRNSGVHASSPTAPTAPNAALIELARTAEEDAATARSVSDDGNAQIEEQRKQGEQEVQQRGRRPTSRLARWWTRLVRLPRKMPRTSCAKSVNRLTAKRVPLRKKAEHSRQAAEQAAAEAEDELAEARRLADEAEEAARRKAEEAHEEAELLADEASKQADEAKSRIATAKRTSPGGNGNGTGTSRSKARSNGRSGGSRSSGELKSRSKAELVDLAAGFDIDGRSAMNKTELMQAIAGARGGRARAKASSN